MTVPRPTPDAVLAAAGPLLTIPEYAIVARISRDAAYRLARSGDLGVPVKRVGRQLRVSKADVLAYVGESTPAGAA